jgi:membrane protein DedA with SNARE-associated domain
VWAMMFIAIGYFFGKGAVMWKSYGIILMIVAGIIVFLFYRMLNAKDVLAEIEQEGKGSSR